MTRLKLGAFTDDITLRYKNGESAGSIARHYKTTTTTTTGFLKKIGIYKSRVFSEKAKQEIINLFESGTKPSQILIIAGISKSTLYAILNANACDLRGQDGYIPEYHSKVKGAQSRERNGLMNEAEQYVFDRLGESNFEVTPQKAVGTYNIDLAIDSHSIAIEVCCRGSFSKYLRDGTYADRIIKLGECGWHVYILANVDSECVRRDGIDDMLAWINFTKTNPTIAREYRMVRGAFDLLACGKIESNNLPAVIGSI